MIAKSGGGKGTEMTKISSLVMEEDAIGETKSQSTEKKKNSQRRIVSRKLRKWIKRSTSNAMSLMRTKTGLWDLAVRVELR